MTYLTWQLSYSVSDLNCQNRILKIPSHVSSTKITLVPKRLTIGQEVISASISVTYVLGIVHALIIWQLRVGVFIYLFGFYVAFNTVQVLSRRVVGRAEETST